MVSNSTSSIGGFNMQSWSLYTTAWTSCLPTHCNHTHYWWVTSTTRIWQGAVMQSVVVTELVQGQWYPILQAGFSPKNKILRGVLTTSKEIPGVVFQHFGENSVQFTTLVSSGQLASAMALWHELVNRTS